MSWRTICITQRCKLEYRMGYMVIRKEESQRIHLSEIGVLIIESTAVSLTSNLLNELNKQKIKVIFCDELHNPYGELIPHYGSHDCSKAIRDQIKWSDEMKAIVWKNIIQNKILNQASNLRMFGCNEQADLIESYLSELLPGDPNNREGHAAKVYFNGLFGKGFSRDSSEYLVNSCLDYGYALILSCFNREIVATGRLTQLGVWHNNMFNFFNLSSDLMEEFRPIVDRYIMSLDLDGFGELDANLKHKLLEIFELDVMINGKMQKLPNAIRLYCYSVFQILDEGLANPLLKVEYV